MKFSITTISTILAVTASVAPSQAPKRQTRGTTLNIIEQTDAPWNLERISSRGSILKGSRKVTDLAYKYRYDARDTATGVDVYVHDTGIDPLNPDFNSRAQIIFTENPYDIWDRDGHGTHVAGTIGSTHYGVAKNVSIWAIKTMSIPMEDTLGPDMTKRTFIDQVQDRVDGIKAAIRQHNIRKKEKDFKGSVMNMSWGFPKDFMDRAPGGHELLKKALRDAIAAGIHITVSGTNSDDDACVSFPSGYVKEIPQLLVVGNVDINDTRARSSDWGPCIDLWAPGTDIKSTSLKINDWVAVNTGTSMAAPLVAGVIATQLAKFPQLRDDTVSMKKKILEMALNGVVKDARGGGNLLLNTGLVKA
ncbi:serine protease [Arthrobotrys megalospora]